MRNSNSLYYWFCNYSRIKFYIAQILLSYALNKNLYFYAFDYTMSLSISEINVMCTQKIVDSKANVQSWIYKRDCVEQNRTKTPKI